MRKQYAKFELPVNVYDEHADFVKLCGDYASISVSKSKVEVEQATDKVWFLVPCEVFWHVKANPICFNGFKRQIGKEA